MPSVRMDDAWADARSLGDHASYVYHVREQELRKRSELTTAQQELRSALEDARQAGMTLQELGDLLGVSRQRVHELLS
jgi:DNA-directed RNA polymerase sigma subunit (sigma70/sigma32)